MKKTFYLFVILVGLMSCKSEQSQVANKVEKPVNYIVLLDLSDRLLNPGQANRDIEIVLSVFDNYNSQVRKNLVINSHDKFQIIIAPQNGIRYNAQKFEDDLFVDMGSLNAGSKINTLVEFGKNLSSKLKELYEMAYVGNKTSDYSGAAIWKFFNENLEFLAESQYDNYLIVLTDGYFDLEDYGRQLPVGNRYPTTSFLTSARGNVSWSEILEKDDMGLLPVKKNFKELKVFVSELSPKYDFQYESDMLIYVWTKWCKEMNTASIDIIPKSSIPQSITLLKNKISGGS